MFYLHLALDEDINNVPVNIFYLSLQNEDLQGG